MDGYIVVEQYIDIVLDAYMKMYPEENPIAVREMISNTLEESIIDIPCTLHNDTYHEYIDTSLLDVFNWLSERKPIISGAASFSNNMQNIQHHQSRCWKHGCRKERN